MLHCPATPLPRNGQIWVVAPCFNEESVIGLFLERVLALEEVDRLVLVDDGSQDATVSRIRAWQQRSQSSSVPSTAPRVTLLELTRNFGKEAAVLAGLDHARGHCGAVVLIDTDLQHPPELIPEMVEAWRRGAEVVTAVRSELDQESRLKVASASWFYRVFNRLVDSIQLREGAGDFRLLSAPVVEALTQMREGSRFSKGLLPWTGYRSVELTYHRVSRTGGRTSWSPLNLWNYALDGIFSFSVVPLRMWSMVGAVLSLFSLLYAVVIILHTAMAGVDVPGYPSLIVAVLFLGGIQLIGIGVLGEYIGRIYLDAKGRPHYFVRQITDSD